MTERWTEAHDRAEAAGLSCYLDPATGYAVMTRSYLLERGTCCRNGCCHCPWDHHGPT